MSVVRLYIDEDAMAHALIQGLQARGIDVTTVLSANREGQTDVAQLRFASQENRAIYTFNVGDFCQLHNSFLTQGETHSGIIVVHRQRYGIGEQIKKLAQLVSNRTAEDLCNDLLFL